MWWGKEAGEKAARYGSSLLLLAADGPVSQCYPAGPSARQGEPISHPQLAAAMLRHRARKEALMTFILSIPHLTVLWSQFVSLENPLKIRFILKKRLVSFFIS